MTILVVEDEKMLNQVLSDELREAGYVVVQAFDGEEALRKIRELKPKLVLLDIVLPKKHDYAVLQEIKKDPVLKHIPVIIDTASESNVDEKSCLEAGAWKYVLKSKNTPEKLLKIVDSYFQGATA